MVIYYFSFYFEDIQKSCATYFFNQAMNVKMFEKTKRVRVQMFPPRNREKKHQARMTDWRVKHARAHEYSRFKVPFEY